MRNSRLERSLLRRPFACGGPKPDFKAACPSVEPRRGHAKGNSRKLTSTPRKRRWPSTPEWTSPPGSAAPRSIEIQSRPPPFAHQVQPFSRGWPCSTSVCEGRSGQHHRQTRRQISRLTVRRGAPRPLRRAACSRGDRLPRPPGFPPWPEIVLPAPAAFVSAVGPAPAQPRPKFQFGSKITRSSPL